MTCFRRLNRRDGDTVNRGNNKSPFLHISVSPFLLTNWLNFSSNDFYRTYLVQAFQGWRAGASLIAESVLIATVRALPGNPITRHSPEIFRHAPLANMKSAPTMPAKRHGFPAAVAAYLPDSVTSPSPSGF